MESILLSHPRSLFVGGFILAVLFVVYRAALPRPIPGIPYNAAAARSVFGDVPSMLKNIKENKEIYAWITEQGVKMNAPVFQLFTRPFCRPWVVTFDYREGQDIWVRRSKEFDRAPVFANLFVAQAPHNIVVMPSGPKWKAQRRLLQDTMTPAFLNAVAAPQIHDSFSDLITLWRIKAKLANGHAFPAIGDIHRAALDAIWAVAFGAAVGTTKSQTELLATIPSVPLPMSKDDPTDFPLAPTPPAFDALVDIAHAVQIATESPFPVLHTWIHRRVMPHMRRAHARKDKMINEGMEKAYERFVNADSKDQVVHSALDFLFKRETAAAKLEERKPQYNTPNTRDELFGFMVAGHDTSATTLAWGVKLLADHPAAQDRLRKEVRSALTSPTAASIPSASMPYLDATIEEILRCGDTVPIISRIALVDTHVLGHAIPAGTEVLMMNNGPGFLSANIPVDEAVRSKTAREAKGKFGEWDAADIGAFAPERWLVTNNEGVEACNTQAGPTSQFGGGPRGCFGKRLAYVKMRIFLVLVIWNFRLEMVPAGLSSYKGKDVMTHQPQQCYVRLVPL